MKNTNPSGPTPLSSTWRLLGCPSASAVESTIALGSGTPSSTTSSSHAANWVHRVDRKIGFVEPDICVVRSQGSHLLGVHFKHLGILTRTCSFIPHSSGDNVRTAAHDQSEECR